MSTFDRIDMVLLKHNGWMEIARGTFGTDNNGIGMTSWFVFTRPNGQRVTGPMSSILALQEALPQ